MSSLKKLILRILRILCTPWRKAYTQRNGVTQRGERMELPNAAFLPLVAEKLAEGHTATIWVKGYSMRPFLENERDQVKLASAPPYQVRDAVLAQIKPGLFVLHRIVDIQGTEVTLQGDGNPWSQKEHCHTSDICGIVTEYIRPGRTIPASDPLLCRRIHQWYHLRHLRRILLLFYRATAT